MAFRLISDGVTPSLQRIERDLAQLPRRAYNVWQQNTPKLSGNARNSTKLVANTIDANYAYADRLNQGYSKKRPQGMSKPTEQFLNREIAKIMRT